MPEPHRMTQADVERTGLREQLIADGWKWLVVEYGETGSSQPVCPHEPPQPAEQPIGTEDEGDPIQTKDA